MRPIAVEIWPKRLILGQGSLETLPKLMAELGARRAMVICGKTVATGPLLQKVKASLGDLCAGVFDKVASHTPLPLVEEALGVARSLGADALISVGGGSAIDAGKGTALLHATSGELAPYTIRYHAGGKIERSLLGRATIPHIAVPTTTGSASEVLPTAGIRDPVQRKKMLFWDDELIPCAVILDPEMAVHTSAALTAASGMTAVARCVETLYSADRNPFAEGLALHALRLMVRYLPVSVEEPGNLEARYQCQVACAMSGTASINSMVSLVHALGHIVGGRYGLQHGVSHSILLAPAMRQLLHVIGERQTFVLQAMGGGTADSPDAAGALAADRLAEFVARLPLKQRLRDLDIPAADLNDIATQSTHDYMMGNLPVPVSVPEIEALLRAAW